MEGKVHGYDEPLLPHMKPEKMAKILSQLPSRIPMNQPHIVKNIPIRKGLGRTGLRKKVPGKNPLLKPKVFSQYPQIQRPTLHSQMPQIPSPQRVIHPPSVERKCYVGQYASMSSKSHRYIYIYWLFCLGVNILHFIVCTAIHNCLSSGSLFFASLRQNN